jgi:CubicO group peptidase (beta-lactamase class C family)
MTIKKIYTHTSGRTEPPRHKQDNTRPQRQAQDRTGTEQVRTRKQGTGKHGANVDYM